MFHLKSKFKPKGDQPKAIEQLSKGLKKGLKNQTLLGVTGSGKTFTIANVIQKVQKQTLVISHNKVLAAQLYAEFKEFFPQNAVHFFVSYYDYYQPEAYLPTTDTYIEKDAKINEEIERLRHAATHSLLTRCDVIVVASVSCIYNIGSPEDYGSLEIEACVNDKISPNELLRQLTALQYERNDFDFFSGRVRLRGDTIEVFPPYEDTTIKIEFFGDEIHKISKISALTGKKITEVEKIQIFPAKHFLTPKDRAENAISQIKKDLAFQVAKFQKENKPLFAERLKSHTNFDIEMIKETGYCTGIENYSRYFDGRLPDQPPYALLDYFRADGEKTRFSSKARGSYFTDDYLLVVDESHISLPQIRGMYNGDRARKETLVNFGFRLPSCLDNRPLKYQEFEKKINQVIYLSATPAEEEIKKSARVVEQIIRPTGLIDPEIEVRPTEGQIENLISEIEYRVKKGQRVLITTLTIRMSEQLTEYLAEKDIKVAYLHHQIDTLERPQILRDLRLGKYDAVVGVNLLREGLDLPEVSLVAILDANKESFLRSEQSLIQIIGRASRHIEGKVIMYADTNSSSMKKAIAETKRRREVQKRYNQTHGITPRSIEKAISENLLFERKTKEEVSGFDIKKIPPEEISRVIKELTAQMELAAKNLEFEKAATLRDQIKELQKS